MNRSLKPVIQLGLALVLALSAGVLVFQWLNARATGQGRAAAKVVAVVVAARELTAGTRLAPEMLRVAQLPEDAAPVQRYATAEELSGRQLASPLAANEAVTPARLAGEAAAGGISAVITPGKRAMAVRGNKVLGMAGLIRPGSMVDVLVTLPADNEAKRTMTKTVVENVPVLSAGAQMSSGEKGEDPAAADVYTLELSPEESEKLALASTQGTLHFALRNEKDSETVYTDGADAKTALASYRVRKAPRAGAGGPGVEIIVGSARRQVQF